jgi:hypothetical protein
LFRFITFVFVKFTKRIIDVLALTMKGLKSIFFYILFYIRDLGGEEESPEKDADDAVTDRVNQVTSTDNPDYL